MAPNELDNSDEIEATLTALRDRFSPLSKDEVVNVSLALIAQLLTQTAALSARVSALEKKIDKGDPPPWVKPNVAARPPKTNPKQKRKPRPNAFFRTRREPTDTVYHVLDNCPCCDRVLKNGWVHRVRQVVDLPEAQAKVTDHVVVGRHCGVCRKNWVPKIDLSHQVVGHSSLGVNLMSLIGHLSGVCRLPIRMIGSLLTTVYGLKIGDGTIVASLQTIAKRGANTLEAFRDHVRGSPFKHGDETGWRQKGQNGYLWSFSTPTVRYIVYDKSRAGSVAETVLGPDVAGVLVCDFYGGYNGTNCLRQRCWVHLLRDLRKLTENCADWPDALKWIDQVVEIYREAVAYQAACKAAPDADAHGVLARRDRRRDFESRLSWLAAPYVDLDKGSERPPQSVLAERCERFAPEMFTFVEYPDVPAENNAAERAIRPCVIARKISGGTRSEKGSETRAANMSLFGTWKVQNLNPLEECANMLKFSKPVTAPS